MIKILRRRKMKDLLSTTAFVPIVKLEKAKDVLPLCESILKGGMNLLEVVFRTPAAPEAIELANKNFPEMVVGAGTIMNKEQFRVAVDHGASFLVSPGLNSRLVKKAQKNQILMIPGVATGTEIQQAIHLGLDLLKFFPASESGGVGFLKAIEPVFPVQFVPTGGITEKNIFDYLDLPNVLCCGGSLLTPELLIAEKKWKEISTIISSFRKKLKDKER